MNEICIKVSSIKRELWIWFALLWVAVVVNIYAILSYDGQWWELFSQLHVVLILSVVFYFLALLLRGLVCIGMWLFRRIRTPKPQASAEPVTDR